MKKPPKGRLYPMIYLVGFLLILFLVPVFTWADDFDYLQSTPMLRISQANDAVQPPGREPTDRETSNMQTVEIISSLKDHQPGLVQKISNMTSLNFFGKQFQRFWNGFEVTQTMLTPNNPADGSYKPKERAPAGFLLYGFYANGETKDRDLSQKIGIWFGVVGPLSGAGQLQEWAHVNLFPASGDAKCWDHQLGNRPVLMIGIEHAERILEYHPLRNDNISFNVVTRRGVYLGTSSSAASVIEAQWGWNPDRHNPYGVSRIGPSYTTDISQDPIGLGKPLSSGWLQSLFLYSSLRTDLIIHDQTLTEREINPRPIVLKISEGVGMLIKLWGYPISITLTAIGESKRYEEQIADHSLVALSMSGYLVPWGGWKKIPR